MKSLTHSNGRRACRCVLAALLIGFTPVLPAQDTLLDGLAGRWDFEEGGGAEAFDTSGPNSNHGLIDNYSGDDSQWVEGRIGGGLSFNGEASNRLVIPHHTSIGEALVDGFSVAAWLNSNVPLPGNTSTRALMEKGNMFFLIQGVASGGMNFLLKKDGSNLTAAIGQALDAGVWHHVAGVFDGVEAHIYLNGQLLGSVPV